MNTHYTYFLILLASLAGPFALSFDKKVAFYKKWKFVFPAMLFPALLYVAWDVWFTAQGVWSFNPVYITGLYIFNLPVEEVLFFLVVPYCCTFIYECIRCYFPLIRSSRSSGVILCAVTVLLFVSAFVFYPLLYTFYTSLFCAVFIFIVLLARRFFSSFNSAVFLITYLVILIPFLVVNGFLTSIPVVLYNNAENLGLRIYTIPAEDVFYGMLLVMMNIVLFELFRTSSVAGKKNAPWNLEK